MGKNSSKVATDVAARAKGLDRYLKKIEKLRIKGRLVDRDTERAYTGGFLEFHAYLERSIERLFLGLLQGRLQSSDNSVRAKISVRSHEVTAAIVKGERSYVNWLPYGHHTKRRARAYFAGGRPFDRLDKADLSALEEAAIIRNALSHESASALRLFKSRFVATKNLPPRQHRPAGYLRGSHAFGQTRMCYYLAQGVSIISKLAR